MNRFVIAALLVVIAACVSGQSTPAPPPAPESTMAARPHDAALADAAAVDAAIDAAIADAGPPRKTQEVEGVGRCKVDSDCVLSVWQEGCGCITSCVAHSIAVADLEKRMSAEKCPPVRTAPCPPPSPCPVIKHRPLRAFCKKNTCWEVRELLSP
jgi:hypothetical protein